jgi:peptidoglycan/xylan/chitin deacetylase (PgdA/CDA1 family)
MPAIRFDRFASVHLFHPLSRRTSASSVGRIPILMYHAIQEAPSGGGPYYETSTSPEVFARHMKFLSDHGYTTITLQQAIPALNQPLVGKRPVVLTFDDGFRSVYTIALPVMSAYGFTATVFLISGSTSDQRAQFLGIDCLTWSEAREMQEHGMSIGSHTVTHPVLATMSRSAIDEELSSSKQTIEDRLGMRVTSFSYPYAFPQADSQLVSYLAQTLALCGYQSGVSTIIGTAGPADHRYFLPRIPVNTWDDLSLFQAKLEGGYDWLRKPQHAFKLVKRLTVAERVRGL